jgi:hypothetical protein
LPGATIECTDPGADPTDPTDPGTDPTDPTDPGTDPTDPTDPSDNPQSCSGWCSQIGTGDPCSIGPVSFTSGQTDVQTDQNYANACTSINGLAECSFSCQ